MSNLAYAIALAAEGFKDHQDKSGKPYILHCLHVMNTIQSREEAVKIAAILHDVVEDEVITGINMDHLKEMGFSNKVLMLMKLVTHDKSKHSYKEYIELISQSRDASDIKTADLKHNTALYRLKGLRDKDKDRVAKYMESYTYLLSIYPDLAE